MGTPFLFQMFLLCGGGEGSLPGYKESLVLNSCLSNSKATPFPGDTVQNSVFCTARGLLGELGGAQQTSCCTTL